MSLELGAFPEKWNDAKLVLIHNSDSKSLMSNYWSISLLDVLSKLLKRQVFIEVFGIVSPCITQW